MHRLTILSALCLAALAAAQPATSTPADIPALVKQLGSDEYTERESASKRLDELGAAALTELRAAARSENPEVVRRARDLLRKIEYRIDNEKTLAPTLVTLDAKNERLDDVLAALSKQAKCDVVLNGTQLRTLADQRITVSTKGEVPFWDAVLRICDAADLTVAGAGGFTAPNALPLFTSSAPSRIRSATNANRAVVLEERGRMPRRPSAVYGAVLVEAVPFPKGTGPASSALLQVWPEPRLAWGAATGARVGAAIDAAGERLTPRAVTIAPPKAKPTSHERLVIVRNPDGSAGTLVTSETVDADGFTPNTRQAVVRFRDDDKPPLSLKELQVAVLGTVRTGMEPLARASKLEFNQRNTVTGAGGVEMTVSYGKNGDDALVAVVTLSYDRHLVEAVAVGAELPGAKGGGPGKGNHTVHGLRITDADGKPYTLGLTSGQSRPDANGRQVVGLNLVLHPDKDGHGPPAVATFWGTYAKQVEVPVVLKDVPLSVAK